MNLKERTYLWYARGGAALAWQQTFGIVLVVILRANPGRMLGLDGLIFRARGKGAK